jgi:hypothetical protein
VFTNRSALLLHTPRGHPRLLLDSGRRRGEEGLHGRIWSHGGDICLHSCPLPSRLVRLVCMYCYAQRQQQPLERLPWPLHAPHHIFQLLLPLALVPVQPTLARPSTRQRPTSPPGSNPRHRDTALSISSVTRPSPLLTKLARLPSRPGPQILYPPTYISSSHIILLFLASIAIDWYSLLWL